MSRIFLPSAAAAVAVALLPAEPGARIVSDDALASITGLRPDTVYRALRDLARMGAVTFTRPVDGSRSLTVCPDSWVWTAIAAQVAGAR